MSVEAIQHKEQSASTGEAVALKTYMQPINELLDKPGVTELCINQPGEAWTEGPTGWIKHDMPVLSHNYCMQVAKLIANYSQQAINKAHPILSASLPGDLRVQIVIPPAVIDSQFGMVIRRPMSTTMSLEKYVEDGVFSCFLWGKPAELETKRDILSRPDQILIDCLLNSNLYDFLVNATAMKKNIAVIGDTGSGKTTLMKSICQKIPIDERLITVEDVHELFLPHGNRLNLLYSSTGQGTAKISASDHIKGCMRLKPDRILLAELREEEAFDFLKSLTTGHSGSITSFHAKNCALASERYAAMCKENKIATNYDNNYLKHLFDLTIDVILHIAVEKEYDSNGNIVGKKRFISEVHFDPLEKMETGIGNKRQAFRAKGE